MGIYECLALVHGINKTVAAWDQLFSQVAPEELEWQPATDQWSVKQITFHVGDGMEATIQRIQAMLTQDTPLLLAFDADQWAEEHLYQQRSLNSATESLKHFAAMLHDLVASLTNPMLEHKGRHRRIAEILGLPTDSLTVADLLRFEAAHVEEHFAEAHRRLLLFSERA